MVPKVDSTVHEGAGGATLPKGFKGSRESFGSFPGQAPKKYTSVLLGFTQITLKPPPAMQDPETSGQEEG